MHFIASLITLASLSLSIRAATIQVSVGAFQNGTAALVFDPNNIQAQIGDNLVFTFHPKNHSVTQSTFANPCTHMPANATSGAPAGIDSGFMPVASGVGGQITVNVTVATPLWFYCRQANHCPSGMVMAVNAPASGNTFQAFLAKAVATTANGTTGTTGTTGTNAGTGNTGSTGANPTVGTSGANSTTTSTPSSASSLKIGSTLVSMAFIAFSLISLA